MKANPMSIQVLTLSSSESALTFKNKGFRFSGKLASISVALRGCISCLLFQVFLQQLTVERTVTIKAEIVFRKSLA